MRFESLVNTERIKTLVTFIMIQITFESLVNTERIKTNSLITGNYVMFESLVNTERIKTNDQYRKSLFSLRVLLIQKESKHILNSFPQLAV